VIIPYKDVRSDGNIRVHHLTPNANKNSPVAVFCHPTGFCGLVFASVACHLHGLNVFAIDMRSHGYSDSRDVTNWSGFAKDIQAAFTYISEFTQTQRFIGIGISSGSSAHILNAKQFPDLYHGLYLCEPILFPPGADLKDREMLAESAKRRRDTFGSRDEAFNKFSTRGPLSTLNQSALALYCTHGFRTTKEGITLSCSKEDERSIYLSGGANGVFEALPDIKAPVKIVYGETSTTINAQRADLIAKQMQNAQVEKLEKAGHFTLFDQPYAGAQSISRFVNSLPSKD
jgi:pimeloyl-ACP methyl ester carboxylesterase